MGLNPDLYPRRRKGKIAITGENILCLRNPWAALAWSAAFPGFGHLLIGQYATGFLLVVWEFFINNMAKLNTAILYTFLGKFAEAREIVDPRWFVPYVAFYVFSMWDSYHSTVELNKYFVLADAEDAPLTPSRVTSFGTQYCDKRHPWLAVFWSALAPGIGFLYVGNIVNAVFTLLWWGIMAHMSHLIMAIQYTLTGQFGRAQAVVDPQWLLFMPSAYVFIVFSSYVSVVEYNDFFDAEQARYLQKNFQYGGFHLPLARLSVRRSS